MSDITETGTLRAGVKAICKIGFLVTPGFAPLGVFGAIEVLRTANSLLQKAHYSWQVITIDGQPVKTVNGVAVVADASTASATDLDMVFVCAGHHPEAHCGEATLSWIRSQNRHGALVGAISTGTHILAKAGVLGRRRCTIHSDNAASLREAFPLLNLVDSVFDIDSGLYTCAGGTSAIDLFINLVSEVVDENSTGSIAHQLLQDRVRDPQDLQSKSKRMNLRVKSVKLGKAIDIMEGNIESPLSPKEVAAKLGVSQRQLQRIFRRHIGRSPKEVYVDIRLSHSRLLLLQTTLPIIEVALASGFSSHVHFSKSYRTHYGHSPTAERQNAK